MKQACSVIIFFLTLILSVTSAHAVPADPRLRTFYQPDGSPFQGRIIGDERGSVVETAQGYTVVKDDRGWWMYAEKDANGQLNASSYTLDMTPPSEKHLRPSRGIPTPSLQLLKGAPASPAIPITGNPDTLVICVDFSDEAGDAAHNQIHYQNLLFSEALTTSMDAYYD